MHKTQLFNLSYVTTQAWAIDDGWYMDPGASHHLKSNLDALINPMSYEDLEETMLGNDSTVPIAHYGEGCLSTQTIDLKLHGILYVLMLVKNLISVKKLCAENNVIVEFSPRFFCVKDVKGRIVILIGGTKQGLYKLLLLL